MDAKQQIRLNFLDEAVEYFDRMESNFLGLADSEINPQQVDIVLRSAHSVKGGAAMMGFNILSQVAHRLEDFLKILRVRYASSQISTEVETLLLQSVDSLRYISLLNRQASEIDESEVRNRTQPIFEQLREHLGDLEVADENALLSQDEDFDPALLVFEEGVDGVLDRFETQLEQLGIPELAQELVATTQELIGFGMMANLEPFILLCQSIQEKAATIAPTEIPPLANQALQSWRRSHALVIRGSIEKLPSSLNSTIRTSIESQTIVIDQNISLETDVDPLEDSYSSLDFGGLQSAFETAESEAEIETDVDPLEDSYSSLDFGGLQSAFETAESEAEIETDVDPLEDTYSSLDLGGLQSAFETAESETEIETDVDPLEDTYSSLDLGGLQSAFDLDTSEETYPKIQLTEPDSFSSLQENIPVDQMVRVPAFQLKQFNTLFEQLILNRNTINLRLQQFQNVLSLMSQRMSQMERSNTQFKQWYDHASVEGLIGNKEQPLQNSVK